jgi:hypothetical protein
LCRSPMAIRHLSSFTLICVGALVAAAGIGFSLGLMGGGVSVVPGSVQQSQSGQTRGDMSQRTRDRAPDTSVTDDRSASIGDNASPPTIDPDDETGTELQEPAPSPTVSDLPEAPARELESGNVHILERHEGPDRPKGQITVEMRNERGDPMGLAGVSLDVRAGPLEWQETGISAAPVRGERGTFAFLNLAPGEYRVRSTTSNYQPVQEVVRVLGGDNPRVVIVMHPAETVPVEFVPRLPDGSTPEQVDISINAGGQADEVPGRFGTYPAPPLTDRRGGIGRARYRASTGGGVVRNAFPAGVPVRVVMMATQNGQVYQGQAEFTPQPPQMSVEIAMSGTDVESDEHRRIPMGTHELSVRVDVVGQPDASVARINIRRRLNDVSYRSPGESEGNRFAWRNVASGKWYLVVEVQGLHAAHIEELTVGGTSEHNVVIRTARLRVSLQREHGTPDPETGELRYGVRILPRGEGQLQQVWRGNMTGKPSDHIDFVVPEGELSVRIESPQGAALIDTDPHEHAINLTAGSQSEVTFVLRAGAELRFRCVDDTGTSFPFAEYLVTFFPAGQVPEEQKSRVQRADVNGNVEIKQAPYGEVYVHVWSNSTSWHSPDRVYRITLPAFGSKDLGKIVVAP